jgi:hypothetical protein
MGRRKPAGRSGKRGRVDCVDGRQATPEEATEPTSRGEAREGESGTAGQLGHTDTQPACMHGKCDEIDLYVVGGTDEAARPFIHEVCLQGPRGEVVRVRATFDDGAMICAMSTSIFEQVRHQLGAWKPLTRVLRMANGTVARSEAIWSGTVELDRVRTTGAFEVFDSTGGWSFLLGKPMLQSF